MALRLTVELPLPADSVSSNSRKSGPPASSISSGLSFEQLSSVGTLYPALMRLEQRGLLRGKLGTTETNCKARVYSVASAGRRQLARERDAWDRMPGIIDTVLHGEA